MNINDSILASQQLLEQLIYDLQLLVDACDFSAVVFRRRTTGELRSGGALLSQHVLDTDFSTAPKFRNRVMDQVRIVLERQHASITDPMNLSRTDVYPSATIESVLEVSGYFGGVNDIPLLADIALAYGEGKCVGEAAAAITRIGRQKGLYEANYYLGYLQQNLASDGARAAVMMSMEELREGSSFGPSRVRSQFATVARECELVTEVHTPDLRALLKCRRAEDPQSVSMLEMRLSRFRLAND